MIFFNTLNNKEKKREEGPKITTLAAGINIRGGKLETQGEVVVDGCYEGSIRCDSGVVVGKDGRVAGRIEAVKITLLGEIEGEVDCSEIEVMDGAKITGKITTENFIIGNGGIFEGEIRKREVLS